METKPIGEVLLELGLINEDAIAAALDEQSKSKERLGDVLVSLGFISEKEKVMALSSQLKMPFIFTKDFPHAPPPIDPPPTMKFLKHYKVVPLEAGDGVLKVATSNPGESYPLEAIAVATGLAVEPVLGVEEEILGAVESYYGDGGTTMEKIIEGIDEKDTDDSPVEIDNVEQLADMAHEAPIVNLVNVLIVNAVERRASDVHIEPFEDSVQVRYRVDGILYNVESLPRRLHPAISSRVKIMSKLNIAERRLPQDGRVKFKAQGRDFDIRVSTLPTQYGESIVMRLLDPSGLITFDAVGFSEHCRQAFQNFVSQPHGMVLVTGPTGSGKTTTLYSALSRIDTVRKKVITIEDPIEYDLKGVNQIQVKPRIGLDFASGLRSIVRQDPDVIMVGEIRDTETADIAIHSALTGHLILSTLHTNDAPGAINRLIDMGIEGYLISSSILCVLAQRLVRVICEHCKVPRATNREVVAGLGPLPAGLKGVAGVKDAVIYVGEGCQECGNTGYKGRIGIFELMPITDGIRQLIVEKRSANELRRKAIEEGMVTLKEDGLNKVFQGVTTFDEVARVTLEQ